MKPEERTRSFDWHHYLEKCEDFDHGRRRVRPAGLGLSINERFVRLLWANSHHPQAVFTEEMLRPESRTRLFLRMAVDNIVTTQRRVAQMYSRRQCGPGVSAAAALLEIMLHDQWKAKGSPIRGARPVHARAPAVAAIGMARLRAKQSVDRHLWRRHVSYWIFLKRASHRRRSRAPGNCYGAIGPGAEDFGRSRIRFIRGKAFRHARRRANRTLCRQVQVTAPSLCKS